MASHDAGQRMDAIDPELPMWAVLQIEVRPIASGYPGSDSSRRCIRGDHTAFARRVGIRGSTTANPMCLLPRKERLLY